MNWAMTIGLSLPASQYGTSASHFLANRDFGARRRRQIDVHPRAEADEAVALAAPQRVTDAHVAQDAARDQPGNLHTGHIAACALDPQRIALVFGGGLVEVGIDEAARGVPHALDL